jgi:succinate dehydrogenase / fumarate reductase iron-sulfur subunit
MTNQSSKLSKLNFQLLIWRQKNSQTPGKMVSYQVNDISPNMSFLEMLDVLNEQLIMAGEEPVQFDNDCREGICGTCGLVINGMPHGPERTTATCQLYMRHFPDGATITIEPFRAKAFPIIKDLVCDRSALDRVIAKGGYISVSTGSAPEANNILIGKNQADQAMDAAECIGCGACVAACPNASASLFMSAKVAQYTFLPQGEPEREERVTKMVAQMDAEGFGHCSNHWECEAVCPKGISVTNIATMRREYWRSLSPLK